MSLWLLKTGRRAVYTVGPMFFMLAVTIGAMLIQLHQFWTHDPPQWTPFVTCTIIMLLAGWLLIEGLMAYIRHVRARPSVGISSGIPSIERGS